jgi:hypothetical protein
LLGKFEQSVARVKGVGPVLVVLAHETDLSARYAAERLSGYAVRTELVLIESLGFACTRWRQSIGSDMNLVELRFADGRCLHSGEVSAVLNRMLQPPAALPATLSVDASYAHNELSAFAASWIRQLGRRVINEPTPQGLSGRWRSPLSWRVLARHAGLPVAEFTADSECPETMYEAHATDSRTILTVAGRVFEPMPADVREAVKRFSVLAQTPLLGLRFMGSDAANAGWRFLDATPYPDLFGGGDEGITAIAELLRK